MYRNDSRVAIYTYVIYSFFVCCYLKNNSNNTTWVTFNILLHLLQMAASDAAATHPGRI